MPKEKILVVEDEPLVGEEIKEDLERLGYVVPQLLFSGDGILEAVNACKPDLVLMDIRLEGSADGIDAAFRLKAEFDVPVIYLSAFSDGETLARAARTAPAAYLLKPFNERELAANVAMALSKSRARPQADERLRESDPIRGNEPLLEALDLPALLLNLSDIVVFANRPALALLGIADAAKLRGEPLSRYVDFAADTSRSERESNRLLIAADGSARKVVMRVEPLSRPDGTTIGSLVVFDSMIGKERGLLERSAESLNAAFLASLTRGETVGAGYEIGGFLVPCPAGSGDLFDAMPIDAERFYFFGLDVMGHGPLASLVAWQLRDLVRKVVSDDRSAGPKAILSRVAELFGKRHFGADPLFFSIALGIVERATGRYVFGRAGHAPIVVVGRNMQAEVVRGEGRAIGFSETAEVEEISGRVEPGSRILVSSDGLLQAFERAGMGFDAFVGFVASRGDQSLIEFVGAIKEKVMEGFTSDDATLLVVERLA